MDMKFFEATIFAKVQARPLIGDEIYPQGCVKITFKPQLSYDVDDLLEMISDLKRLTRDML
jgi:hypothetical protein